MSNDKMREIVKMINKRLACVCLLSLLCLCSACGKNENVKNAENLISQIGTVTIDSWDEIETAQEALDGLGDADLENVDNKHQLELARESFESIISDYNRSIASAVSLISSDSGSDFLMKNVSDGVAELERIRAELPDEVVEKYILFDEDESLDEYIRDKSAFVVDNCYPNTTVMTFDKWLYVTTGVRSSMATTNYGTEYYKIFEDGWTDEIDALWNIKYAYDDYIKREGFTGRVTCGLVGGEGIDVTLR